MLGNRNRPRLISVEGSMKATAQRESLDLVTKLAFDQVLVIRQEVAMSGVGGRAVSAIDNDLEALLSNDVTAEEAVRPAMFIRDSTPEC